MQQPRQTIDHCVACRSAEWSVTEAWNGYQLATCNNCLMAFTVNPDYSEERYVQAYERAPEDDSMSDPVRALYALPERRLELELAAYVVPGPWLTVTERHAMRWLRARAPRGATIIDCGCGTGRFLIALKRTGLDGVGVEVSARLVELLRRRGVDAIEGTTPGFTWDRADPFAMTFFEVLEHIPDPTGIVATMRSRFPTTQVLASVPSPRRPSVYLYGQRSPADYPPNHFLRWTPPALEEFFRRCGYSRVQVLVPGPDGSELMPGFAQLSRKLRRTSREAAAAASEEARRTPGLGQRSVATAVVWTHRIYRAATGLAGSGKAYAARRHGASGASMLVIAEP